MATANNNFITGAVLGDLVLGAYNTNNIWFINNNTNTTRMRLDSDGGGTFSGFVSASGPKAQIRVDGNSVGCGITLNNTIVGSDRRNWGIFTEQNVNGDFVINRSNSSGGSAQSGTTILSLLNTGAATFSSSVTIGGNGVVQNGNVLSVFRTDNTRAIQLYTDNDACYVDSWAATSEPLRIRSNGSGGRIEFYTNATERMRITSGGQVQINSQTSSNDNVLKLFIDSTQASIQATYGSTGSYVPIRFLTSDTERMRIDTNGCVNIGTTGGFGKLDVGGQTSGSAQNICRLGNISGVNNGLLIQVNSSNNYIYNFGTLGTGTVVATANVLSATSDMNLKVEDGYIDNALEKVLKLKPRYFYWKEETGMPTDLRQLGFYAQEVNEAIGEEVANSPKNDNEKWGIYDRGMIAFLTKAIQEQTQIIKNLEARIVSLESK